MPDIKYVPSAGPISSRDYYQPQSVFAAGVAGLEHGLTFGANLAAKVQDTQNANDPEKLRAEQLERDLRNAHNEEVIKAAKLEYERDQIFGATERQSKLDAEASNTTGQNIRNQFGAAREQSDIDYKRAATANIGSGTAAAEISALAKYREGLVKDAPPFQAKPRGMGSSSDLPSPQSAAPPDPNADIIASIDARMGELIQKQTRGQHAAKLAEVDAQVSQIDSADRQSEKRKLEDSVLNQTFSRVKDHVEDVKSTNNPDYGNTLNELGNLAYDQKSLQGEESKAKASANISYAVRELGGRDRLEKAINSSFKDPSEKKEALKTLNEATARSNDPDLYTADQKDLFGAGMSAEVAADPDKAYDDMQNVIRDGAAGTDSREIRALATSPFMMAAAKASKNGQDPFKITFEPLPTGGDAGDVSGGGTSKPFAVFTNLNDPKAVAHAAVPEPNDTKGNSELNLVTNLSTRHKQSLAAAQGVKQQHQDLQQSVAQDAQQQSQAAANPNSALANTNLPDVPSEKAEAGRPGIEIINSVTNQPDPNGDKLVNHSNGIRITNLREGPTSQEYREKEVDKIYNSQLDQINADPNVPLASSKVLNDARKAVDKEMATFEQTVTAPALKKNGSESMLTSAIQSGNQMSMKMEEIANDPLMPSLLGPGVNMKAKRALARVASGPEADFMNKVDKMQAEIIGDFIQKVQSVGATNTEGEMTRMAEMGITAETSPETVKNMVMMYNSILERRKQQLWLSQRMRKDYQDPSSALSNYNDSPESYPVIINPNKFDSNKKVIPGHENDDTFVKNPDYQAAVEWIGFQDPKKEREKIAAAKAAAASAPQAPAGGGSGNGGFPVNNPPSSNAAPVSDGTGASADVANTQKLSSQADLAANSTSVQTTVGQPKQEAASEPFDPSVAGAEARDRILSNINKWIHGTNVTESGRAASHATSELERAKQDPSFREVVNQMKAELNSENPLYAATGYGEEKNYDPGILDFALEAVTPEFMESLGKKIIENPHIGILKTAEQLSSVFGGATGDDFYRNYKARMQAREEIFNDARVESPYQSIVGEMMAFGVLGQAITGARLQAVKTITDKFPKVAAAFDYITGGSLSGKTGTFVKATKDAVTGGIDDTATIKAMDGGSDVISTLAFTSAFRGAAHLLSPVILRTLGIGKSLTGNLSEDEIVRGLAERYKERGGTRKKLKRELAEMKAAVSMQDIETLAFKDNELAKVFKDLIDNEPGGRAAAEELRSGVLSTEKALSTKNESSLPPARDSADIKTDIHESLNKKLEGTINVSEKEQKALLEKAKAGNKRETIKDLSEQRRAISRKSQKQSEFRDDALTKIIDGLSNTEKHGDVINNFLETSGLERSNLSPKSRGGSPTTILVDERISTLGKLEDAIQDKLSAGYYNAERVLDNLDEVAIKDLDDTIRSTFPDAGPKLIQQNAKELEHTTKRVSKMEKVSSSDKVISEGGPLEELKPTGEFELAPTLRSLDEFRQLVNRTPLNQRVREGIVSKIKRVVNQQAKEQGLGEGWYDKFLSDYGASQEAKAAVIKQSMMLGDVAASMEGGFSTAAGGYELGGNLYSKFRGDGELRKTFDDTFGKALGSDISSALKAHDRAFLNIKKLASKSERVKASPSTKYSKDISKAEENLNKLETAKEDMFAGEDVSDIVKNVPNIAADLKRASKTLGSIKTDIAGELINGRTKLVESLMTAMGDDAHLLEESVTGWIVDQAKNSAKNLNTTGSASLTDQLKISPRQWKNISKIIGDTRANTLENYIRQQTNINKSIEILTKSPESPVKEGLFASKGPNIVRRFSETPLIILDILSHVTKSGSLNNKAYRMVKNLGNPDFAKANEYAKDIVDMLKTVEDSHGNEITKVIEREWGTREKFAAAAVRTAIILTAKDKNLDQSRIEKFNRR